MLAVYAIILPLVLCIPIGVIIFCMVKKKCCFASKNNSTKTSAIQSIKQEPDISADGSKQQMQMVGGTSGYVMP